MRMTKLSRIVAMLSLAGGIGEGALVPISPATAEEKKPDGQAEARAVIARAVKAHGGEANLGKFKVVSAKWTGKSKVEGSFWDSVSVVTYRMPDKIRYETELQNPNGGKLNVVRVINGTAGWQGVPGRSRDLRAVQVTEVLDHLYALWVASLVPLNDKVFEFSPVGEIKVDDKEAVGVRVSRKDRPDVNLYFDKKTGLLVKCERRTKDAVTGEEYTAESLWRDHKEFHGVMWPTKRIDKRDGADLDSDAGKFELGEFQAHDTLDEKLLEKP